MSSTKQQVSEAKKTTEGAPLDGLLRERSMQKTQLIQRLEMPFGSDHFNPFEFGVMSDQHGGLQDKAYKILNAVFSFDYMGAAEYEWGAIPNSLSKLWDWGRQNALATGSMKLSGSEVFYICNKEIEKGVKSTIRRLVHNKRRFTRDYVGLDDILEGKRPKPSKPGDLAGWLELDNHFMFFVDEKMFLKSASLLGIDTASLGTQALKKNAKR